MNKMKWSILGIAVVILVASGAWAQGMGGWGMMGDGDMPMMGGGQGMMGGGMGYGSCGTIGGGAGMMGGGMGMMGYGAFGALDLTKDQQAKINKIQDDMRKQHWALMGKMMDEQSKLRDLYGEEKLDAKKIGAVNDAVYALRKQMLETRIDATNRMREVLTKEQREQLNNRSGYGMTGPGHRHGSMMGQ